MFDKMHFTSDEQEAVESIITQMGSSDPDERKAAYAALKLPINSRVEANSIARMVLNVDPITSGEAKYPVANDDTVEVLIVPALNTPPQNLQTSGQLTVPTFDLVSSFEMPESYIENSRINMVANAMTKMKDDFVRQENAEVKSLITDYIGTDQAVTDPSDGTYFTYRLFLELIEYFDDNDAGNPDLCLCSPGNMTTLKDNAQSTFSNVTRREFFEGRRTNIDGVDIVTWNELGDDYIYMFDTTRWGVMPITHELETREDPKAASEFMYKVNARETNGFAVLDKTALARGTVNTS